MTDSAQTTQVMDILDLRAQRLAAIDEHLHLRHAVDEIVIVALGNERFGFSSTAVREIRPLESTVKLPGLPPHCLGLTHLRGELICVIDIRTLLGVASHDATTLAVVVEGQGGPLAIVIEELLGFCSLYQDDLHLEQREDHACKFISGVTKELISLVHVETLVNDPQLHFNKDD